MLVLLGSPFCPNFFFCTLNSETLVTRKGSAHGKLVHSKSKLEKLKWAEQNLHNTAVVTAPISKRNNASTIIPAAYKCIILAT